jgi:predicted nucleotidyltransferase
MTDIQTVADTIAERYRPERIILFGSHAWGQPSADSDYDLLIIKSDVPDRHRSREIDSMFCPRDFGMDVVIYTPAELEEFKRDKYNYFIHKILDEGKVLYPNR